LRDEEAERVKKEEGVGELGTGDEREKEDNEAALGDGTGEEDDNGGDLELKKEVTR
jgi:hypothetical protein